MYDKKKIRTISNFICPECGLNFPLPRNHGRQRKNIYCPKCDKIQKFREYKYKQGYKTLDGEIIDMVG